MSKLTGVFSTFPDLEQIPLGDIARWLKPSPDYGLIENFIANKILYPQTIPVSRFDLSLELAILRELIKRHKNFFQSGKKLILPKPLVDRLPNLSQLTLALIDSLLPKDVVYVELEKKIIGTVIRPQMPWPGSKFSLNIGKGFNFKKNMVTLLPLKGETRIKFKGTNAKLMEKDEVEFNVSGGALGLLIDGRGI